MTRECRTCLVPVTSDAPHGEHVYCDACTAVLQSAPPASYVALVERAFDLALLLPTFADDLHVHDRVFCARHGDKPFAWAIGDTGTWIARPNTYRDSIVPTVAMTWPHMHVWDGVQLHRVTTKELSAFLRGEHLGAS